MSRGLYEAVKAERFGNAEKDLAMGVKPCEKCGRPTLYGRHVQNQPCVPCLDCDRAHLTPRYPCVHDVFRDTDNGVREDGDPLGAELPVWGLGRMEA